MGWWVATSLGLAFRCLGQSLADEILAGGIGTFTHLLQMDMVFRDSVGIMSQMLHIL